MSQNLTESNKQKLTQDLGRVIKSTNPRNTALTQTTWRVLCNACLNDMGYLCTTHTFMAGPKRGSKDATATTCFPLQTFWLLVRPLFSEAWPSGGGCYGSDPEM